MATKMIITSSSSSYYFNDRSCKRNHNFTSCQSCNVLPTINRAKTNTQTRSFFNFSAKYGLISTANTYMSGNLKAKASSSPNNPSSSWKKWLLALLLTISLPAIAIGYKGRLFLNLKAKIDQTIETVDHVVEVVEDVAEKAEKIMEEVEDKLPSDSKLKESLESFDNLAKSAVIQAKRADDIVHKVKYAEEELEESLIKVGKGQAK